MGPAVTAALRADTVRPQMRDVRRINPTDSALDPGDLRRIAPTSAALDPGDTL